MVSEDSSVGASLESVQDASAQSAASGAVSDSQSGIAVTPGIPSEEVAESNIGLMSDLASLNQGEKKIALTVNGVPIYRNEIEFTLLNNQVRVAEGLEQLEAADLSEEKKQEMRSSLVVQTEQEVIEKLIEQRVQKQEAECRGITVDVEAIYEQMLADYRLIQQSAKSGDARAKKNMAEQDAFIEGMGYDSPEEYFRFAAEVSQSAGKITELRRQVIAEMEGVQDTDAAYEAFVNDLVAKAEIVYVD